MREQSAVTTLIARGRLRQVRNLLIHQASLSVALLLGGAILLLILGTQILNWYWLVILFAVSLAVSIYRGRNKILSRYRVAQSIDAHLGFHDALSTAYFFSQHPEGLHSAQEMVSHQRETAEDLARSADLRQGVPFFAPRTFYVNAALALAVASMFGVRYGITRSMDLRASLIHIDFDGFLGSSRQVADAKKRGAMPFEKQNPANDAAAEQWESKTSDLEPQPDTPLDTIDDTETSTPQTADSSAKSQAKGKDDTPKGDDLLNSPDKNQNGESNSDKQGEAKDSPNGEPQSGNQDAQQNSDKSSKSGDNSSLADKVRDAFSNLMAKMKSQPKNTEGKQQGGASGQPNQQSAQKQQNQNQQNQKGNPGEQQSENNGNSQQQGDQQQSGAQQSAQNQGAARNSDQTTKDGKSGIGRQDGDKTTRQAEQLAAMGKISEIIGKRAANVSGEVMVEVQSGKQQLKTQYTQRDAQHAEAGGEINRDEVPLVYQQYVQQYFDEIRKEPAAKPKPDSKPSN